MSARRALLVGGLLALGGLAAAWFAARTNGERAAGAEVLRIGYAVEEPYAMVGADGSPAGAVPEVARRVAERLGAGRVEWRLSEFGELIEELEAGSVDVVAAGLFITPERERRVAFSEVLFEAGPGLLVRAGNPRGIAGYADLARDAGATVAALAGAVEGDRLRAAGVPEERIVRVPDAVAGRALVAGGRADAFALSAPSVRWLARQEGAAECEAVVCAGEGAAGAGRVAFAFRKGDAALVAAWNRAQAEFMAGRDYGEIAERHGFSPLRGGAAADAMATGGAR